MQFIISGPSGVGKGTIIGRILPQCGLPLSRSWTTRTRRPGEPDDAYVWATHEEFEAHAAAGGFLEHAEFGGNRYGTPVPIGPVLLEIEIQGARQVKQLMPDAELIFLVPPGNTLDEQIECLMGRQIDRDGKADTVRLNRARIEIQEGTELADHIVVNDHLDVAASNVLAILTAPRKERSQ